MSFKDFCKNDNSKIYNCNGNENVKTDGVKEEKIKESIEENLQKYSNLSNEELLDEFLKQSKNAKKNGMYNNDNIEKLKNTLFPLLSEEQKTYFNSLIKMVE